MGVQLPHPVVLLLGDGVTHHPGPHEAIPPFVDALCLVLEPGVLGLVLLYLLAAGFGGHRVALLIGEDARKPGEFCRSDSMILLSVNTKTKKIVACSVLRDIYVTIPGRQPNRLNAAYAYGGSKLLKQTLAENFNIQVENHMTVDFFSFVEVVDIMGGVDITMTQNEVNFMNGALHEINQLLGRPANTDQLPEVAGTYHLNGAQALSFARNRRNGNGDFSRTRRQRDVLYALAQKAKTLSLSELDRLFNAILPKITTNMSKSTLKSLISNLPSYLSYQIEMTSIPKEGTYRHVTISKRAVMLIDFKKNNQYHYDLIYQ